MSDAPPPVLDMARVIAYAIVDESVHWTGKQKLFVGDKELGPVPKLALCQNVNGDMTDILIFHCNDDWKVIGISGGKKLDNAKISAERAYRGITAKWISANVTEEEARAWIKENYPEMSCSFCERLACNLQQLIESKSGVRVCNYCIDELYALIHKPAGDDDVA